MRRLIFHGSDSFQATRLARSMFRAREREFVEKKNWELQTEENVGERDHYDSLNPVYLIVIDTKGRHLASARLMPVSGPTMLRDVFSECAPASVFEEQQTWEVTRFFGSSGAGAKALKNLMLAGLEFGLQRGISSYVGITDPNMRGVFSALGWPPETIGAGYASEGAVAACRWRINEDIAKEISNSLRPRTRLAPMNPFSQRTQSIEAMGLL